MILIEWMDVKRHLDPRSITIWKIVNIIENEKKIIIAPTKNIYAILCSRMHAKLRNFFQEVINLKK